MTLLSDDLHELDMRPAADDITSEIGPEKWLEILNKSREYEQILRQCRSRFETIKETNPSIHLNDDIAAINRALS